MWIQHGLYIHNRLDRLGATCSTCTVLWTTKSLPTAKLVGLTGLVCPSVWDAAASTLSIPSRRMLGSPTEDGVDIDNELCRSSRVIPKSITLAWPLTDPFYPRLLLLDNVP